MGVSTALLQCKPAAHISTHVLDAGMQRGMSLPTQQLQTTQLLAYPEAGICHAHRSRNEQ